MSPRKPIKKAGRPKLPKGDAKAIMLRVRITPEEQKAFEAAASIEDQTVSQWVRETLTEAVRVPEVATFQKKVR